MNVWAYHHVKRGIAHLYRNGFAACGMRTRAWHERGTEEDVGAIPYEKKCRKCLRATPPKGTV